MAKSIIQAKTDKLNRECFLCRLDAAEFGYEGELIHEGLHKHHFMHGTANRKLAESWGLWAYICPNHHRRIHDTDSRDDEFLIMVGQKRFEQLYSHEKWMEIFGKNYLP